MKDEQKRIDEMAILLQDIKYTLPDDEDTRYRYFTRLDKQSAKEIAEALIAAGCRKQSDTAKEILQYLYQKIDNAPVSDIELIKYLAAQYGVEVE